MGEPGSLLRTHRSEGMSRAFTMMLLLMAMAFGSGCATEKL